MALHLQSIPRTIIETDSGNENRPRLFDKLKEFAQKLTDNGLTLSFLRRLRFFRVFLYQQL
jgi:hypothetical protein